MFDTHAHLNFKRFKKNLGEVINESREAGVSHIVIPGTDEKSSQKAVELAEENDGMYAAVGIHPHHVFDGEKSVDERLQTIRELIQTSGARNVVAIGEIGLDRHQYENTKYEEYHVDDLFINRQKEFLIKQLAVAKEENLSIVLHNREATADLLTLLNDHWDAHFEGRMVFHCCEPDPELLNFAKKHNIFIGVDGDITYNKEKQSFVTEIPSHMLVLETDSPFLLPEPLRTQRKFPNTPANMPLIAEFIADLRKESAEELKKNTLNNGLTLFGLQ